MSMEDFFYQNPIFRLKQFAIHKSKASKVSREVVQQSLQYYLRKKRIVSVRRGLFAVVPPGQTPDELKIDPYALAGMITEDSVLAYHTALELHGFAYSHFLRQTFKTSHKVKAFHYDEILYQPVFHKHFIQKEHLHKSFTMTANRNGTNIHMTNLASTYVDVLDRPDLCGGWEEVYRSLGGISILPIAEAIEYCLALESPVLCAKLGYFLEQRKGAFAATSKDLDALYRCRPKSPYYLTGNSKEPCNYIKQWNLMIPKSHITSSWEEPNLDA